MTDAYYTPAWLADEMASALPRSLSVVADFAAGKGSLLDAVERRYDHSITVHATDRDQRAVHYLRDTRPGWRVGRMNLLSLASRAASRIWSDTSAIFDGVILNPPFSYRGGASLVVSIDTSTYRTTPAVAFVAYALRRIAEQGTVVALLPSSALRSDRDRGLWEFWSDVHDVTVLDSYTRGIFAGAFARTSLVRVIKAKPEPRVVSLSAGPDGLGAATRKCTCVELIRGRVPVHRMQEHQNGPALTAQYVHTTDLVDSQIRCSCRRAARSLASYGPLLLIPRVGKVTQRKIALQREASPIVLSDCLMAIRMPTLSDLGVLRDSLLQNFEALLELYDSSCAPYVTIDRLTTFLENIGYSVSHRQAGSLPSECTCTAGSNSLLNR